MRHLILVILLLPIFYGVGLFVASEYGGEVVELDTYDARGNRFTTPLWVVDLHGEPWLRAGDPESAWLQRMRRNPEVEVHLKRDGQRTAYLAEIVDGSAARINHAMREKYAWADLLVSTLHDEETVVAIRLAEP
ncbi:MAG: hypothetical protein H6748_10350 [Spirochaetaceae bacterium]|nr:hypothetical protein [Myxococcales bacterium]MCB9724432.1 hypothetical protein [Spirochaetaceae bacterium]